MKSLEKRWNDEKVTDDTFAARPTKFKMPEDYPQNIRAPVTNGLLDPVNDVRDCQLLFACACGTMFGFWGNQASGLLLIYCLYVVADMLASFSPSLAPCYLSTAGTLSAAIFRFCYGFL
jgi:hypothetical protein